MRVWHRLVGRRPIVTRLVVAVAAAMAVVLALAAAFVYWRVAYALDRQVDQDLDAYQEVVEHAVSTGQPPPEDTPGEAFQVYDERGRLVAGNDRLPSLLDAERLGDLRGGQEIRFDVGSFLPPADVAYRVDAFRVRSPSGTRYVASAISRRKHDEALRELLLQLAIADLAALVAASFVGYRTARAALDPVERYRRTVERLERGSDVPHERLPVDTDRDDELTRLGHTFNDLLDRLEDAARRERQFLADASHELRSPLSLMRTELEWHRHRPRSEAETATVLASLQGQVDRLVDLANALLEIEELRGTGGLTREAVAVDELVAAAVRGVPAATRPDVEVDAPAAVVQRQPSVDRAGGVEPRAQRAPPRGAPGPRGRRGGGRSPRRHGERPGSRVPGAVRGPGVRPVQPRRGEPLDAGLRAGAVAGAGGRPRARRRGDDRPDGRRRPGAARPPGVRSG